MYFCYFLHKSQTENLNWQKKVFFYYFPVFCSWYVCIINTFYCNLVNVTSSDSDLKITIFFSSSSFCPLSTFSCVCICHVYYVVEHERKTEKIIIFHANFPIVISNKIKLTNTCTVLQKKSLFILIDSIMLWKRFVDIKSFYSYSLSSSTCLTAHYLCNIESRAVIKIIKWKW